MNNIGGRIDWIHDALKDGKITESTAKELAAPLIREMNKKKIKREKKTGKEPKLFTFEYIFRGLLNG